ncbi:STAS domain-containing protein [Nocardioides sp.]|uniref:STAS domain-containing protein n=1 Tax=Nocardioides sp. TaxID=35761 RepID=UPI003516FF20
MFEEPLVLRREGDVLVVAGSVDEFALVGLRVAIDDIVEQARKAVVDVSEVAFLPSAAVGVLVQARGFARRQGGELIIVAADGSPAQRTLSLMGVDAEFSRPEGI